jgi:hypothetical protein
MDATYVHLAARRIDEGDERAQAGDVYGALERYIDARHLTGGNFGDRADPTSRHIAMVCGEQAGKALQSIGQLAGAAQAFQSASLNADNRDDAVRISILRGNLSFFRARYNEAASQYDEATEQLDRAERVPDAEFRNRIRLQRTTALLFSRMRLISTVLLTALAAYLCFDLWRRYAHVGAFLSKIDAKLLAARAPAGQALTSYEVNAYFLFVFFGIPVLLVVLGLLTYVVDDSVGWRMLVFGDRLKDAMGKVIAPTIRIILYSIKIFFRPMVFLWAVEIALILIYKNNVLSNSLANRATIAGVLCLWILSGGLHSIRNAIVGLRAAQRRRLAGRFREPRDEYHWD